MGTDDLFHKRKARLAETHRREKAKQAPYERVLIVCEGMKTEPYYFRGLRLALALHPANIVIEDKKSGLDPKSLMAFAIETFKKDKGLVVSQFGFKKSPYIFDYGGKQCKEYGEQYHRDLITSV